MLSLENRLKKKQKLKLQTFHIPVYIWTDANWFPLENAFDRQAVRSQFKQYEHISTN